MNLSKLMQRTMEEYKKGGQQAVDNFFDSLPEEDQEQLIAECELSILQMFAETIIQESKPIKGFSDN